MSLHFEWNRQKAQTNIAKHGVAFDEASTAFKDVLSITISDPVHSQNEERFVLIGYSCNNRLLVVVHTERGDCIRIISARLATKKERTNYEKNA
jgi:uncharacterized DUF497 family protein